MRKNERWGQWHIPLGATINKVVEIQTDLDREREFALMCDSKVVAIFRVATDGGDYFNPHPTAVPKGRQPRWHRIASGERVKSLGRRAQIKQESGLIKIRFLQRR